MKLWLLEILACPIDHAFPLELSILNWQEAQDPQKTPDKIADLLDQYSNRTFPLPESPIHTEIRPEGFFVRDFLVLKSSKISDYLHQLLEKIKELDVVQDKSNSKGQEALQLIKTKIKDQLNSVAKQLEKEPNLNTDKFNEFLQNILPELTFLNLFKYQLEIEDGLIVCPQCHRWFPIFETIPQMLPDDLRQVDQDKEFQKKWVSKIQFPKKIES